MRNQTVHIAASLLLCAACALPGAAQAPVPDSPAIEQKIDSMIAKMTLEQKLEIIGGVDNMFIRAEPSAGFPSLKMSDGPEGVRTWGPDTAYAGGIALAASWDPALAEKMGVHETPTAWVVTQHGFKQITDFSKLYSMLDEATRQ